MFSKMLIAKSTENYWQQIDKLKNSIKTANVVLIRAGAGLSTSAGLTYSGERFMKYFSDFHQKYGISDMYSDGFYPYETLEEYWAWWSRHIYYNIYHTTVKKVYSDLLKLVEKKNYFVLTTNVDYQFQLAGFDKQRLFYTQSDYGLWQCSKPCHQKTYSNEETVNKMIVQQENMKVPNELIPYCPKCGKPMAMNLRCDDTFVQDEGWNASSRHYQDFINCYKNSHILFLELGVGMNTPVIIKYPFWQMTLDNPNAVYCQINIGRIICPTEINAQSICINNDIGSVLNDLTK